MHQNDWEIWFQINNQSDTNMKRKKRDVQSLYKRQGDILSRLKGDSLERAKEIIIKHNTICHNEKYKDTCAELIAKLHSIINHSEEKEKKISKVTNSKKNIEIDNDHIHVLPSEVLKRETNPWSKMKNVLGSQQPTQHGPNPFVPIGNHQAYSHYNPQLGTHTHLPDTCLLAKLLKQNYPQAQGIWYTLNLLTINTKELK